MDETEPEVNTSIQMERTALDAKKFAPSTGAALDKPQPCPPAASESRWPLSPARPELARDEIHAGAPCWTRRLPICQRLPKLFLPADSRAPNGFNSTAIGNGSTSTTAS